MSSDSGDRLSRVAAVRRVGAFMRPHWGSQATTLLCLIVGTIFAMVPALLTRQLVDVALPQHDFRAVAWCVGLTVTVALAGCVLSVYQSYLTTAVAQAITTDIRTELLAHVQRLPLRFFIETRTGEIMNRVNGDADTIAGVLSGTLVNAAGNAIAFVFMASALLVLEWRLGLMALLALPIMILPVGAVAGRAYDMGGEVRARRDDLTAVAQESLSYDGVLLMKTCVAEAFEHRRFAAMSSGVMDAQLGLAVVQGIFAAIFRTAAAVGPAMIWLFGAWLVMRGGVSLGTILVFVTYLAYLYGPVSALVGTPAELLSSLAVFERVSEYLAMPTEDHERHGAVALPDGTAGEVVFRNVCFSYQADRPALDDVSFTIAAGQLAAVVGPSGAGKSTIVKLLPGLLVPNAGTITIDQCDLSRTDLASLRRSVGVVDQDTYIFHDTVAANLRLGRADATDADIETAAEQSGLHETISKLPAGYETILGERGHKLSGGERQRLSIARVLLKRPRIVVFDEPTSALDAESEAVFEHALVSTMAGRTRVVVSHRLSTIRSADVVFVMEGGRLVERGTHAELLNRDSLYAQLYRKQLAGHRVGAEAVTAEAAS